MAKIEINIYVGLEPGQQPTIGHVREWLAQVDKFNLPDNYPLYNLSIELSTIVDSQKVNPILCGNCAPSDNKHDIIITTHSCDV